MFIFLGTSVKIAVRSIQHSNISSITLRKTDSGGVQRDIPLTKCTNAFLSDVLKFKAGRVRYEVIGTDMNGAPFLFNVSDPYIFQNDPTMYTLTSNVAALTIEYTEQFHVAYEISSKAVIGTSNLTFSVNFNAVGFHSSISPSSMILQPQETRTVIMTSQVRSRVLPGGRTYSFTLTADNGCIRTFTDAMVTVNPLVRLC